LHRALRISHAIRKIRVLEGVQPVHHHQHERRHNLEDGEHAHVDPRQNVEGVQVEGVGAGHEQVAEEHHEEAVVELADAVAGERAVVVALQDAPAALVAVPAAGRRRQLALLAEDAPVPPQRLQRHAEHARVDEHGGQQVAHRVRHEEGARRHVPAPPERPPFRVELVHDDEHLEPVEDRHHQPDEHEAQPVAETAGQEILAQLHARSHKRSEYNTQEALWDAISSPAREL